MSYLHARYPILMFVLYNVIVCYYTILTRSVHTMLKMYGFVENYMIMIQQLL